MDRNIEVWIAEFNALREEIANRTRIQQSLMMLNLTALATMSAIALSSPAWWNAAILLVLPVFSSLLHILYLDHHLKISDIGHYIRDIVSIELRNITGDYRVMEWESWSRAEPRPTTLRVLTFWIVSPAFYILPSLMILVITYKVSFQIIGGWAIAGWILGLVLTFISFFISMFAYSYWIGKKPMKKG